MCTHEFSSHEYKALLAKWWWKLVSTPEKAICRILKEKYGNKQETWSKEELYGRDTMHFWATGYQGSTLCRYQIFIRKRGQNKRLEK